MDNQKLVEYTVEIVKSSLAGQNDNPGHGLNTPEKVAELISTVYVTLKDLN